MIQLTRINKIYKTIDDDKTTALLDINLDIKVGDKVIIIGESGAGKSTLLNIIGGIDRDYDGQYCLMDDDMSKVSLPRLSLLRNEYFGFVFQDYVLVEDDSVYDNVVIPLLYSNKFKKKEYKNLVAKALNHVELIAESGKKVKHLSGGQRQRVAIARALVNEPEVLILDEPTGALNRDMSNTIMDYLYRYVNANNKTMIMVTHDLDKVKQGSCRLITLSNAKIIKDEYNV